MSDNVIKQGFWARIGQAFRSRRDEKLPGRDERIRVRIPVQVNSTKGVEQARTSPVENVVVGEYATIDVRSRERYCILRTHPVVNAFRLKVVAARNTCFEIDDARVGPGLFQFVEGGAPDIGRSHRPFYRAIGILRQLRILQCRLDVIFMKRRVARLWQYLVDAAPEHHIAAQKKPQRWPLMR